MKKIILACLLLCVYASAETYTDYLTLLTQYPETLGPFGDYTKHEIEVIRDPVKMDEIALTTGRKVGIVHRDKFWIWLNDAVQFPNGKCGVYGRILWVKSLTGTSGVAVMPVLPNGKIFLNRNYRHATRSWEFELPRGLVNTDESVENAARREVKEETGLIVGELQFLGKMAPDTGLTTTVVPVYMAKIVSQQASEQEDSEAIAGIHAFTVDEIRKGFKQGYIVIDIEGTSHKIPLRDPFLAFALFQAGL